MNRLEWTRNQWRIAWRWMPAITALVLPLHPRLSLISLIIWGLMALLGGAIRIRNGAAHEKQTLYWASLGPVLYFTGLIAGMFWTQQMDAGWFALEVKSTLIILPVLFGFQVRWSEDKSWISHAVHAFLIGLGVYMCWRFVEAFAGMDAGLWRYDGLAGPFHPTYMAVYLTMGLLFMPAASKWRGPFLILSAFFIGLLASKAGWMVAAAVLGLMFVANKVYSKRWDFLVLMSLFVLVLGGAIGDQGRLGEFIKYAMPEDAYLEANGEMQESAFRGGPTQSEQEVKVGSSGGRIQAWNASWIILKGNPWGVGTGDVVDELMSVYTAENAEYAKSKQMNPHSAYWQAFVTLGWLGGFLLILWWGGMILQAARNRAWSLVGVAAIISCHGIFESVLELQQGVVAWVFISLLIAQQETISFGGKGNTPLTRA